MSLVSPLGVLATWLAGEFENQSQALAQPAWFVSLRWWHRPMPLRIEGGIALFAEQANALYPGNAYRQRVLVLDQPGANHLRVRYWGFKQPQQIQGAGANPALLQGVTLEDLEELPGCQLVVSQMGDRFVAVPPEGARCYFQYDGQRREVVLGFEVSDRQFWSRDRGIDPENGRALWGAILGAYEFHKCADFSGELPL